MAPKIVAHALVRNEQRFIWYSLMSALPYVDHLMVWDTGSTDQTIEIIKSINNKKISFRSLPPVDPHSFTKVSQQMINKTPKEFTWIMVLDGDEIWPGRSLKKCIDFAKSHPDYESIVVRSHNLVGDIYHALPQSAGQYHLAGHKGHLALRFMNTRTIPGLHFDKPHGQRGLFDDTNTLIQDRDPKKIKFINVAYLHATHLPRSSSRDQDQKVPKRAQKLKYELGVKLQRSDIPQVFFDKTRPAIVPDVTTPMSPRTYLLSLLYTLPRRFKRLLITPQSGY